MQELYRTGENRNSTLGGHTQGFTYTGTQHKAVTPQEPGLDPPTSEGLLGRWERARTLLAEAPENTNWCELSWRSPFWHQDLALSNSLQVPVLEHFRPNNQQVRNTPISRQMAYSHTEDTATSKHTTWHDPAQQKDKIQLHTTVGRHQSIPPGKPVQTPGPTSPTRGQTPEASRATIPQSGERKPQTQQIKQNDMTEKYTSD